MKAIVNGVTLEGTPEEIMEYQMLHEEKLKKELMVKLETDKTQWLWALDSNRSSLAPLKYAPKQISVRKITYM